MPSGTGSGTISRGRTATTTVPWESPTAGCVDAGEEVVYLIPDGPTDVTKSERTGCWPDVFARVLAYKEAYVQKDADTLNGNLAGPLRR